MPLSLVEAVQAGPLVLDGGIGTLLESRGDNVGSALWSARILLDSPDHLVAAHRSFFEAGASIAISASYQASFEGFASLGLTPTVARQLLRRSVELAKRARDELPAGGGARLVAASVGPYGAILADGSEYRGDYALSVDALRMWHEPRIEVLASAGADALAIETIPSIDEIEALVRTLEGTGVPAWISLTPSLGRTRAGESLRDAFALASSIEEVVAIGVNCCHPSEVLPAIEEARAVTEKPVVVYPNSGEQWDAKSRSWTGTAAFPAALVEGWLEAGASLVGGCCRVGPSEIEAIAGVVGKHRETTSGS